MESIADLWNSPEIGCVHSPSHTGLKDDCGGGALKRDLIGQST